jgi:hypothetical protein
VIRAVKEFHAERRRPGEGAPAWRGSLEQLCGWNRADFEPPMGWVALWSDELLTKDDPFVKPALRAPRLVVSAGMAAWARLTRETDPVKRREQRSRLRRNLLRTIVRCREPGTRAALPKPETDLDALGKELGELLLAVGSRGPGE